MQTTGRKIIYTDATEITYDNVISVLMDAFPYHEVNRAECKYLLDYERGKQPLQREKTYRKEIDIQCIHNVAHEIAQFWKSFDYGNPITLAQRGDKDSGNETENKGIALLNECFASAGIKKKTQELSDYVEITGIGYTYIDINMDYEDGDSYFNIDVISPENCFVIRSARHTDHRILMAVSFYEDKNFNRFFSCFTKDSRYEVCCMKVKNGNEVKDKWGHDVRSGEINPLNAIPIIEWIRDTDRMGCFERQIPQMDSLNIAESDFVNDVDQNTQCIWHTNDIRFPEDENGNSATPTNGDWVQTYTTPDGKTPSIKPLTVPYDYSGMLNHMVYMRSSILENADVPQTNLNSSGGSTGVAMSDATGWSQSEIVATAHSNIMKDCKMEEVRIALKAIHESPFVPQDSELLNLRACDIDTSIKRQKTYELTTKANFIATLISKGFHGGHVIEEANAFNDPQQVWIDSKEGIEAYQRSIWDKQTNSSNDNETDKIQSDVSDQLSTSPVIDKNRG